MIHELVLLFTTVIRKNDMIAVIAQIAGENTDIDRGDDLIVGHSGNLFPDTGDHIDEFGADPGNRKIQNHIFNRARDHCYSFCSHVMLLFVKKKAP